MSNILNRRQILTICIGLTIATIVVFWQVYSFDFINFDDHTYVVKNLPVLAGLTRSGIAWAFTTTHTSNWHPLTWLSHMLDCQLFNSKPGWHHLTNVFIHLANTLLLFTAFKKMTGALWPSAFIAAAFAFHPLHVESVAWISERKDVLSTFFGILALLCYAEYVKRLNASWYLLMSLAFALSLMAKPMLVTLPFVLLLLDYWPLGRFKAGYTGRIWIGLIREKTPLFILSVISSTVTFLVQKATGAVSAISEIPLSNRFHNAIISYITYIWKMVWPNHLAVFYPYPGDKPPYAQVIAAAILLLAITILIICFSSRYKYLATGWLWYIGTLIPVIGLVQVGMQSHADRYTYVPMIGLFVVIAFGTNDILGRWKYKTAALSIAAIALLITWSILTALQLHYWRNNNSLFQHALQATKNNYLAYNLLAYSLYTQNKFDESIAQNLEALKIKPDYPVIHNGLGLASLKKGKLAEAVAFFEQAVRIRPDFADAHANLGSALYQQGKFEQAIAQLTEAVALNPQSIEMRIQFANCLLGTGRVTEAVRQFKIIVPCSMDSIIINNLAWYLAVFKGTEFYDPIKAVHLAQTACKLNNYQNAQPMDTLAAAYAATGRFEEAVDTAEKALNLAQSTGDKHLADSVQQHLNLFRYHQPYVESLPNK